MTTSAYTGLQIYLTQELIEMGLDDSSKLAQELALRLNNTIEEQQGQERLSDFESELLVATTRIDEIERNKEMTAAELRDARVEIGELKERLTQLEKRERDRPATW